MVKNKENSEDLDFWATNSEEGGWNIASTDEGSQKMTDEESEQQIKIQTGSDVVDDYFIEEETSEDERMIVNMGPQHPSTHGVLRLQVELEGEAVRRVKPIIGYLHTGMEKTGEELTYLQGPTNTTRMDYLSPFFNELVFSLTTEQLLDMEVPARAQTIRILMTELNRISSHLVALATGGMDIGALSMMIFGFRERELVLNFFEKTTGLRMNHNYIRPGGVAADLPDDWQKDVKEILKIIPEKLKDYDEMLLDNPIWKGRLQNVGILTAEECLAYGITGPSLRASGHGWDLRKMQPYSGIEKFDFEVPVLQESDVFARWRIKVLEILESLKIVEQAMDNMPKGPYKIQDKKVTPPPRKRLDESMEALIHHFKIYTEGFKVPEGEAYVAVESPRGELGCYIVSDGSSKPYRIHVRGPSFCNLQALPIVMADSPIADAVAAIASLDPVIGDGDR
jgi:NADH-quinone oxidoreductase subunit D